MKVLEHIPLAPLTTLGVGGPARYFIEAHTEADIEEALSFAREHALPLFILGKGSNVLVPDTGVEGVVLLMSLGGITTEEDAESVLITAGAGSSWEEIVDSAVAHQVFGIENLAGIPGSLGGAAVQNIGAYGAEFSEVFEYADTTDQVTGEKKRVTKSEASFAYRTSFFKEHPELLITRVALRLSKNAQPNVAYPDMVRAQESGASLTTPNEIAAVVRGIRALKFPQTPGEGVAGSFFKNPIVSEESANALAARFSGLPVFPQEHAMAKLSLAWMLDHILSLKGYTKGNIRLYEKQPIVIVARTGATAKEVEIFAEEIAARVKEATDITIEREVETFGTRK
ncbi:MAG: UDP-N-acetylmuramate dehydrogenase [Candidatus Kaiserbacteria bacterium]|nr:UDP-N-acetylmuramate dehydrogenase [Candidatus Kaiserbacteria bacterium]